VVYLPHLYANIINDGVARGNIGYILTTGALMLAISLAQVGCSVAATYFGAQAAMAYGRDLRGAIFHRVGEFSAHEVGKFGAPSLITRTTNDVQQIQTVVLMGCTMLISAPIICVAGVAMALHEDLSLSRLLLVSVPVLVGSLGGLIWRMVPQFEAMQPRIGRRPRGPRVRPRAGRGGAVRRRQRRAHRDRAAGGQAAGGDVPGRAAGVQRVDGRLAVVRWPPGR
jgi:ATP-binding cassette subfamily B protein